MAGTPQRGRSDQRLLTLLALRLKGLATVESLAATFGFGEDDLAEDLAECHEGGLARSRGGDEVRWLLTDDGRTLGEKLLAVEVDAMGVGRELDAIYQRFLPPNRAVLQVCTRWQVRSQNPVVLNGHDDPAYDAAVVEQLAKIHSKALELCAELETLLSRFSRYGSGFEYALARIANGADEWFTKPTILSYHTLWFELHEDLLATLGLDRADETAKHQNR